MSESGIPTEVEQFITARIKSLEQLEVLLLLSSAPDQIWSIPTVNQVVRSSESSVRERLYELSVQGLLIEPNPERFRFSPVGDEIPGIVAELGKAYKERRVRVIELIYSPKTSAAEEFAKAFRIRKEKQ